MVTYKDATQVLGYRCVYQQAKKVNSRAIFLLIAVKTNLCEASTVWIIKQTNTNFVNQTNKLNKQNCTYFIKFQYILDH